MGSKHLIAFGRAGEIPIRGALTAEGLVLDLAGGPKIEFSPTHTAALYHWLGASLTKLEQEKDTDAAAPVQD